MTGWTHMQSDNQGFLTGGTPLGLRSVGDEQQMAGLLGTVREDTHRILAMMRKHAVVVTSRARAVPAALASKETQLVAKAIQQAFRGQAPTSVPSRATSSAAAAAVASKRAPERPRDEVARTLASMAEHEQKARREDRAEQRMRDGNGHPQGSGEGQDGGGAAGRIRAAGGAVGEVADQALSGTAGLDPTLAAAEEMRNLAASVKNVATPVMQGIGALTGLGGSQEQKQTGWLKRIAQTLGWSRRDAKAQADQQARGLRDVAKAAGKEKSGGLLSMLPLLLAGLPAMLKRFLWQGAIPRLLDRYGVPSAIGQRAKSASGWFGRMGERVGAAATGAWAWAKSRAGFSTSTAAEAGMASKAQGWLGRGSQSALKFLGRLPVIGTALTGLLAWMNDNDIQSDPNLTDEERRKARAENLSGAVGSLAGGSLGMVLGGPIGAVIGAWLGGEGGKLLGEPMMKVYDFIRKLTVWDKLGEFADDAASSWGQFSGWVSRLVGGDERDPRLPKPVAALSPAQAAGAPGSAVSTTFESGGNPNAVGNNKGDPGGPSYGLYQLSTNTGTLKAFLAKTKYGQDFKGLEPGTPDFKKKWEEVQAREPADFQFAQLDFLRKNNVIPASNALKAAGLDLSGRGRAVQEMLFSTATQFGPGGPNNAKGAFALIKNALSGRSLPSMSDADIVTAVQNYKLTHNAELFRSSPPNIQASTARRAIQENTALLKKAGAAGASAPLAPATPNIPALSVPAVRPAAAVAVPPPQEPASTPQRINGTAAPTIVVPPASAPIGQNVPDRGIAHVASGGIGWRSL